MGLARVWWPASRPLWLPLLLLPAPAALTVGLPPSLPLGGPALDLGRGQSRGAREEQSLWSLALPLVHRLVRSGRNVTIIDVGANVGDFGVGIRLTNNPVQDVLRSGNVRAVLVEPNPPVFKELVLRTKEAFGGTERIRPVKAAVCAKTTGEVPFYAVSQRFASDFPEAPHWMKSELSSMDSEYVWHSVRAQCRVWTRAGCSALDDSGVLAYIENLTVPCKTPRDLLADVDVRPQDVDLLKVDAEGFDGDIVLAFLALEGFLPYGVIFEGKHLDGSLRAAVVERIKSLGYETNCDQAADYGRGGCPGDVLAWRKALPE
mmetsp:Transcript_106081/g.299944  ORF Transcript_106081/g.299944 Transcript_106081/m.299944 type:complete len:318 (-) Transcript_106081:68-1021(-)